MMPIPPLPPRYEPVDGSRAGGGMGETVLCEDTHLERRVLVKTLRPGTDTRRIRDEVAALAEVRSKHVVQLYDVIVDGRGEVVGLVEEFLDGEELAPDSIHELDPLLRVGYAIAQGIADIHEHGVVHRDIKPSNMKFDGEGCLKIYDFGLARFNGRNAHTVYIVGTPGFMAPELLAPGYQGGFQFDAAVDTFAFAITLAVLVTGVIPTIPRPFTNGFPFALPLEMASLLDSCLASSPHARPSMRMICDCFRRYLVRDKHRAFVATPRGEFVLSSTNRQVTVNSRGRGSFLLSYDGITFSLSRIEGGVYVNNESVSDGFALPGSCVIVLGAPAMQRDRVSISVDISHPEVVL